MGGEEKAVTANNIILASPVTHSDWMLRDPGPAWGIEGVRQIIDRARECGWRRIYWRCFDGGRPLYPSKIEPPLHGYDEDNYHAKKSSSWVLDKINQYDWGSFDSFAEAIRYGHEQGLEVHAWLSINEDDHAWGLTSRFTREHPETRWVRRDGTAFRSQLSFAFPQVRKHKLALVKEILGYAPDGLFFDWIRTGDVRDGPHTDSDGVAIHGYEQPNCDRFKELHNVAASSVPNADPRWVRVRVEPQTVFMRAVRELVRSQASQCVISVMVHCRFGYRGKDTPYDGSLRGLLLDLPTWAEESLIDEVVAAGYYRPGGSAELAYHEMVQATGGKARVWIYGWLNQNSFRQSVELAEKLGASQVLLWESDYVGLPPASADFVKAMREYAEKQAAAASTPPP